MRFSRSPTASTTTTVRGRLAVENPLADALSSLADTLSWAAPASWSQSAAVDARRSGAGQRQLVPWKPRACAAPTPSNARGSPVRHRRIGRPAQDRHVVAKDVPPLGYRTTCLKTFPHEPAPGLLVSETNNTVESPWFKAVLDPANGRIASLVDKRTGRELLDAAAPQGFGQYFYERSGARRSWTISTTPSIPRPHAPNVMAKGDLPESAYESGLPRNLKIHFEKSPIAVSAVMSARCPPRPRPDCRQPAHPLRRLPVVDLEVRCQKPLDAWPEAGGIAAVQTRPADIPARQARW